MTLLARREYGEIKRQMRSLRGYAKEVYWVIGLLYRVIAAAPLLPTAPMASSHWHVEHMVIIASLLRTMCYGHDLLRTLPLLHSKSPA